MVRTPPPPPRKITIYIGFYRNKDLHPPPPTPQKIIIIIISCNPPPPPPPINVSTLLNRKKNIVAKNPNKKHPPLEFFLLFESGRPRPLFLSARRGWRGGGGGGYYNIFIHTWARTILGFKILNFNTFEGFHKNDYFLGYEDFVDIFLGHHKTPKS